jgi:glycine/D-amino acid oxidase-like deaminating enzyme
MPDLHRGHPLWALRRPAQTYPALKTDLNVDVAIVGGGMTGATVATVFSHAGLRVAVLEAGLVAMGSTVASSALLLGEPDMRLLDLGRRYGARRARRIWELSGAATRDVAGMIRRLRIRCDIAATDSVYYTLDQRKAPALRAELECRQRTGLQAEGLDPDALRRVAGLRAVGAIRSRRNAQFNPYEACRGLMRAATRAGAHVYERTRVRRINRRNGLSVIATAHGSVRAAHVVIATGYAAPAFQPPRAQRHRPA